MTKEETPEQIVEANFKGLSDLIDDKDLVDFYKGLVVTCIEEYANQQTAALREQIEDQAKIIKELKQKTNI